MTNLSRFSRGFPTFKVERHIPGKPPPFLGKTKVIWLFYNQSNLFHLSLTSSTHCVMPYTYRSLPFKCPMQGILFLLQSLRGTETMKFTIMSPACSVGFPTLWWKPSQSKAEQVCCCRPLLLLFTKPLMLLQSLHPYDIGDSTANTLSTIWGANYI